MTNHPGTNARADNVLHLHTPRPRSAAIPFPNIPFTRADAAREAELDHRAARMRADGERTHRLLGAAYEAGKTEGAREGWRAAFAPYFAAGVLVGAAVGAALLRYAVGMLG